MERDIIILTKSYKHGGLCIAGIDKNTGEWIRPISENTDNEGAVPNEFADDINIFDVVEISLIKNANSKIQPENYIYDSKKKWIKKGVSTLSEVINLHPYDNPQYIFYNNNNSINFNDVPKKEGSLLLLPISKAEIFIKTFEQRKVQLNFVYNNCKYKYFKISDINYCNQYKNFVDGSYSINNTAIICSLTDVYNLSGKCYKMVANIL